MIKIHKLEDGDVIKILPMIDKSDKISWIKPYDCAFVDMKIVYDDNDKSYLRRISHKLRESNSSTKLPITKRYGMNIYIDGEIRETLSTHVAEDNDCDIIISSWTHTPYHYHDEVGSLINYGLTSIMIQSIYLIIQKKIMPSLAK